VTAPLTTSIAREEFAASVDRLHARSLDDPHRRLPLSYIPSDGNGERRTSWSMTRTGGAVGPSPIGDALVALAERACSARELVLDSLDAVARLDPELNAIATLVAEQALAEADQLDAELTETGVLRPLHGVPITIKDVIDVGNVVTRGGSAAYEELPTVDAVAVARLRAAGAIVIAKTTTHEFALGVTNPQSRNPHDPTRIPGGSSGGSAIAVATGMGLAALGTDTRASIRVPASLSGTVGFKPTFGRVPSTGVVSLSWTMDHVAPMAMTVTDAARVMDVLIGGGSDLAQTERAFGVSGLRLGVPTAGFTGADADVDAAVRAALRALEADGAVMIDTERPSTIDFDDANAVGLIISRAESASFHRTLGTDLSRCWTEIAEQLEAATAISAVDYLDAQRARGHLADALLDVFSSVDVLAMPTTLVTAPPVDDFAQYLMVLSRNAIPWSLIGFPAISIPCGTDRNGLPIGLQLVAPPHREADLVAVARAYEDIRSPGFQHK
jgi:aspartyl-tRNA(Asn)/glutamyl-tRNA(Gln) amidotransferase subunit A